MYKKLNILNNDYIKHILVLDEIVKPDDKIEEK